MRLALPPTLLLLTALLAGCAGDASTDEAQSSQVTCINDVCEVCVDGACAPCDADACDACRDGTCPELDAARDPAATVAAEPLPDVDVHETIPLTQGLPERTWTFDAAPGATGHVRFVLRDQATKEVVVMGTLCFDYKVLTPEGRASSRSNCGGASGLILIQGGSTNSNAMDLGSWTIDGAAHFVVKASSEGMQANELVVDAVIDNP